MLPSLSSCVVPGEKHVDADYESVHSKFSLLNASLLKLRSNSSNYIAAIYSVFQNSNNVSVDFAELLEETAVPNDYQEIATQSRMAHNKLNSDKQHAIASSLTDKVIAPIDVELKVHQDLLNRIGRRNELHSELEYYLNKIHGLNKDRETRSSKGKSESSSEMEKFNRNNDKLNQARADYTTFTSALMADLTNNWNGRVAILGPAMASFIQAEKSFLQLYATELNEINKAEKLPALSQAAPAEAMPPTITSADVPPPVVAGDLQNQSTEGVQTTTAPPAEAWSERQAAVASQYPTTASSTTAPTTVAASEATHPMAASAPYNPSNPFDETPRATTQSIVPVDLVEQTVPGGVAQPAHPSPPVTSTLIDPSDVSAVNAKLSSTMSPSVKSQGEEESKRQKFESEQKLQQPTIV